MIRGLVAVSVAFGVVGEAGKTVSRFMSAMLLKRFNICISTSEMLAVTRRRRSESSAPWTQWPRKMPSSLPSRPAALRQRKHRRCRVRLIQNPARSCHSRSASARRRPRIWGHHSSRKLPLGCCLARAWRLQDGVHPGAACSCNSVDD